MPGVHPRREQGCCQLLSDCSMRGRQTTEFGEMKGNVYLENANVTVMKLSSSQPQSQC